MASKSTYFPRTLRLQSWEVQILGYGTGYLKFTDLRTGKEFARYKFRMADPDNVQKEIVKILEAIPGA